MKEYFCVFVLTLHIFIPALALKPSDIRLHLGTRTPYRLKFNKDAAPIKFPGCKESKIWMIIRHGTRLPSAKDIIGMNSTLKELKNKILVQHNLGKGELSKEHLKILNDWTSNVKLENQKFLTEEGKDEMVQLAKRTQRRFSHTIPKKYDNSTFYFRFTATQRALESAKAFAKGLFNEKDSNSIIFEPGSKVDTVLRFYKHCDRWQKQVKKNPKTYEEQNIFGKSKEMNNTLVQVSKIYGLDNILSLDEVSLMYKICGYETSWTKDWMSPWCYGFDENTIKIMEYYFDLKHYWMDGYGHDLTYKQACMSIKTMFDNFIDDKDPKASFLFAHSGTLLKILSHLQLYKPEEHLRGDAMDGNRSWIASNIDCFASNLAFVLYNCNSSDHVLTLHQEKVIKLPMCEQELCPLKLLMDHFKDSILNCDYTDMCSLNSSRKDEL